jgi:GTP cyclohydrolase I
LSGLPLSRIVEISDQLFPFANAEGWDNCGVQIGDPAHIIRAAAFSLDATPATVGFASRRSCDLLVTHHPLIMQPIRTITADSFVGRTIMDAVRLGIDILSLHTNLDAAPGGLNDFVASRLGLEQVIVPHPATCARVGTLPAPMTVSAFASKVRTDLGIEGIRIISSGDPAVRKVFCSTGSGMGYFQDAVTYGVDLILTGDVRYHAAREALEMGMPVLDAGHFGLEKHAAALMAAGFRDAFAEGGFAVECVQCDSEEEPFVALV